MVGGSNPDNILYVLAKLKPSPLVIVNLSDELSALSSYNTIFFHCHRILTPFKFAFKYFTQKFRRLKVDNKILCIESLYVNINLHFVLQYKLRLANNSVSMMFKLILFHNFNNMSGSKNMYTIATVEILNSTFDLIRSFSRYHLKISVLSLIRQLGVKIFKLF